MGSDWAATPAARRFREADEVLGTALSDIMSKGPLEELERTRSAQPATLVVGVACCEVLRARGVVPDLVAGRSVGEFTAAVAAGVLGFEEALRIVSERGRSFETVCRRHPGAMVALHDVDPEAVGDLCARAAELTGEICVLAGVNAPRRVTLSGGGRAIAEASRLALGLGAEVLRLRVSGAFHSPLMSEAAEDLEGLCRGVAFRDADIPMATGVDGRIHVRGGRIKENILRQVVRPVRWEAVLRALGRRGAGVFVEIGPGQGLAQMAREVLPGALAFRVDGLGDVVALEERLRKAGGIGNALV